MTKRMKFRNAMITQFYEENKEDLEPLKSSQMVKFSCGQREVCPTTQKHHLQLYVEFNNQESMKSIKDLFEDHTIHIEERKGTQQQAIDYVTKEDTRLRGTEPFFYGKKKMAGHRSDLDSMVDMMEDGHTAKEILLEHRGNGLKHINMIVKGLHVLKGCELIDKLILYEREFEGKNLEGVERKYNENINDDNLISVSKVNGNTEPFTETPIGKELVKKLTNEKTTYKENMKTVNSKVNKIECDNCC